MAEFNGKQIILAGLKGEKGDPGPQGPQGEKGEPGDISALPATLTAANGTEVEITTVPGLALTNPEGEGVTFFVEGMHLREGGETKAAIGWPTEAGTFATREWVQENAGGSVPYIDLGYIYPNSSKTLTIPEEDWENAKSAVVIRFGGNTTYEHNTYAVKMYEYEDHDDSGIKVSQYLCQANGGGIGRYRQRFFSITWTDASHTAKFETIEITDEIVYKDGVKTINGQSLLGSGDVEIPVPDAQKVLEPGWGDGEALPQSLVSYMAAWPSDQASPGVDVIVQRCGLGAFVPQDGKRYECLFSIGGTLYCTSFLVDGINVKFDSGNREALKPGDIVTMNGVTMMVKAGVPDSAKNIWDVLVPLRGRFPVMPSLPNGGSIVGMRDCEISVKPNGGSRASVHMNGLRNCSVTIDTSEYSETGTGEGKLSIQVLLQSENLTLVSGGSPVMRDAAGNAPDIKSVRTVFSGTSGLQYRNLDYIVYDQNGVIPRDEGDEKRNNQWFYVSRPEWAITGSDGATQRDLRLSLRYEFAESGQPRFDLIPYTIPHVEQAAIAAMSLAEPAEAAEPSVPSGRRGCFTLDEQGRTIDAFTGEVVSE